MTEQELQRLKDLCAKATPGPWDVRRPNPVTFLVASPSTDMVAKVLQTEPDAEFIAAARTALPEALAEIRRLREAISPEERARLQAIFPRVDCSDPIGAGIAARQELRDEVARLKDVLSDCDYIEGTVPPGHCFWCGANRPRHGWEGDEEPHSVHCRGFTPDGEVR